MSKRKTKSAGAAQPVASHILKVARDGDWLAPCDFSESCCQAVADHVDMVIDLEGLDHLDASALQILLALRMEQQQNSRRLSLTNASTSLLRWFEFAGAIQLFSLAPVA